MSEANQSTPATTGTSEQLDRIEAKLDWLLEALSGDEEGDEAPQTVQVRTLDGGVTRLPVGNGGGFL